jgi:ketosteroid isomerase-like protein
MNTNERKVVEAFVSAINRHDLSGLSRLMSADHAFVDSSGTVLSGRDSMMAGWTEYFRMFPDYQVHVEKMLVDGSTVAVFGSASGTYQGKRGLVAENKIVMPAAWKALVENGQIEHWQVYADWTEGWKTIQKDIESG